MTEQMIDIVQRLRLVRRMERQFLKRWATQRVHASPDHLDRVAADVRQACQEDPEPDPTSQWMHLIAACIHADEAKE